MKHMELASIRQDFDRFAKRNAQLRAFIANAEPLLPKERLSSPVRVQWRLRRSLMQLCYTILCRCGTPSA